MNHEDNTNGFQILSPRSGKEIKLTMESLWLTGTVTAVGARLQVCHTFRSQDQQDTVAQALKMARDEEAPRSEWFKYIRGFPDRRNSFKERDWIELRKELKDGKRPVVV